MITVKHYGAALGFAFVATWIGLGFGAAILCLLGALAGYGVVAFLEGGLDMAELQGRLGAARDDLRGVPPTRSASPARPVTRPGASM
ncbi:MAG: hypothetical protein WKF31_10030 [Thermoleophilaceae bacterium]